MNMIQFYIQADNDGGYTAEAVGHAIYTQGDTLDETVANIREAVECHFDTKEEKNRRMPVAVSFALPEYA